MELVPKVDLAKKQQNIGNLRQKVVNKAGPEKKKSNVTEVLLKIDRKICPGRMLKVADRISGTAAA